MELGSLNVGVGVFLGEGCKQDFKSGISLLRVVGKVDDEGVEQSSVFLS